MKKWILSSTFTGYFVDNPRQQWWQGETCSNDGGGGNVCLHLLST